jgi:phosphate binding protein
VFPLSERIAARFKDEGYKGNVTVDSIGTGAGFERFCKKGETDIANASRQIKPEEAEACKAIGREAIPFRIGTDAIALVVSKENTFLDNVTIKELAAIYSPTFTLWSDINPAWPKEKIQRFSPGTDSGTFDYFVEAIFAKDKKPILASNPQLSEDDNVLVQGVEGSPYAIGYFGFAYYLNNMDKLKALKIEGVAPSRETAHDFSYKLARPLFLYSTAKILKEKPQVAAFINFYLSNVDSEIDKVGYFTADAKSEDESRQLFLTSIGQ